jgi:8-oxo-dGTP pyrophosphatase MutT (NUDIX family)
MTRASGVLAAMKAVPGGGRGTPSPQSGGWGSMSPVAANAMYGNSAANSYGPFLPRPSQTFTDGAFGPMSPIQPVPVDEPPPGGQFPDPRWWQYRTGWNLPTQPGTEGLKLASFDQLYTLANKYSVARQCIELRKEEIRGLEWSIELTTKAAKAYQGDHKAMRDFGERAAEATKFFRHPDPDFFSFSLFLDAALEEIFTYDALALVMRPKYGKGLGRGLLGSDLDSIRLVSGPTVRPLLDMHGGKPRPPAPAYQQFLYGVPRSDYQTVISGSDIDDYGLAGAEVNEFRADTMLYLPLVARRETPYGFPPVERALLPIISGLQKQEFQLNYFTEGTVPAVYISPGDPNMTPTQIRELQDALNGIAGDPAYHLKVLVLPPGSKVEPQRPVDLADGFDLLVQTQVAMAFDVMPTEIGLLPNVGGAGAGGASNASAVRFGAAEARDLKTRKSTKPLLMFLCDIMNYVIQDLCGQQDMQFSFEGLVDDEDKQAITSLGVEQVQNAISSIDEVRERLDLPPWGLQETSEPVVFTAQGPMPLSMAQQLIANAQAGGGAGGQGTNGGQRTASSRTRPSQPSVRRGGTTKPNGSHPAPVAPHREAVTPAHSAAAGAIQSPTPRTGGTTSRSSVAGSRKKAAESELSALARHLRKGRQISTWVAEHIPDRALGMIAEDLAKGVLIDTAVERAGDICLSKAEYEWQEGREAHLPADMPDPYPERRSPDYCWKSWPPQHTDDCGCLTKAAPHWPGWERDLGLVGAYKQQIGQAFHDAETRGSTLRKKAATGGMFVSNGTLRDLISDEVRDVFSSVLTPLWTEAWHLGYQSAKSLCTGLPADFTAKGGLEHLQGFIGTEGGHWLDQVARTGLGNNSARSELIARTEVARAVNSAAIQCYRDNGVQFKHLLLSPNACDICKDAADDGDIPLDAPFSAGGLLGTGHPGCRCAPAPAGVNAEPPLAHLGKTQGYTLNARSGMISLDVPEGTITPVPGGVTDHHITVVYLGPDVDDDAYAEACQRAANAAAAMPGPLLGAIKGVGTFPPSDSSDGKVPAWAGVTLPGAEMLREALEDLSASEHKDWKPHVTLAYVEAGEPLPDSVPATPVAFTHLSVHRGDDEAVRFPLGPAGKSAQAEAQAEDESRLVWLLLRARGEDGKWRFLLQQRADGTWGMPGGKPHAGEDPWAAALRETEEEIGKFPPPYDCAGTFHHVEGDGKTQVYLWLCTVPWFSPSLDGATPEETRSAGWFRRKEISALGLAGPFREDWETGICLKDHVTKALQRTVDENGQVSELTPASQRLQAVGSRWPYPHRADGTEDPEMWPDAGPGAVPGASAGGEPPNRVNDFAGVEPHSTLEPRGGDDGKMPRGRKPNPPASRFPDQGGEEDGAWPQQSPDGTASMPASPVVPKADKPVTGSVPAEAPQGYRPHQYQPQAFDPGTCVVCSSPLGNIVHDIPKGASDLGDPNPVEAAHVHSQMLAQFPPGAISWVKSIRWIGPISVPQNRIDYDDEESWAAHHQPGRVRHFARKIKAGEPVAPGVSVQKPGENKIVIVDGRHRALGHREHGKAFPTYIGFVPRDTGPWDETHSSQRHQGDDPGNKVAE